MSQLLNRIAAAAILAAVVGAGHAAAQDRPVGEKQPGYGSGHGTSGDQPVVMSEPSQVLNKLHFITQFDIKASELAQARASSDDVKDFAKEIVKEQTKLDKKISKVANDLGIELTPPLAAGSKAEVTPGTTTKPGSTTSPNVGDKRQEALDKLTQLSTLSGMEFDREYINAMKMCADRTVSFLEPTRQFFKDKKDDTSDKIEDVVEKAIDNAEDHQEDIVDLQKKIDRKNRG
jgi:predicted outer membrane protein